MNKLIKKEPRNQILNSEQIKELTSVKNVGEAMLQTGQEFLLVVEQVLMDSFGFSEKDLIKFHDEVQHIMTVVREAEGLGMNAVGIRTVRMLSEIAEIRKRRAEIEQTKILLPQKSTKEIVTKLLQ